MADSHCLAPAGLAGHSTGANSTQYTFCVFRQPAPATGTRHQQPGTGMRHRQSGTGHRHPAPATGTGMPAPGIRHPAPGNRHRHRASGAGTAAGTPAPGTGNLYGIGPATGPLFLPRGYRSNLFTRHTETHASRTPSCNPL